MKTLSKYCLVIFAISFVLFGCAKKSEENSGSGPAAVPPSQQCTQAGYLDTVEHGCVPQGNCSTGQAYINNSCTNVTLRTCPSGYTGTAPNCTPSNGTGTGTSSCSYYGLTGTYPNCVPANSPPGGGQQTCQYYGLTGTYPQCCRQGFIAYPDPYSQYGYQCYWYGSY